MIEEAAFQRLAEAYGADPRRWPAERRQAAEAFQAAWPDQAAAILASEAALDDALDVLRPPAPTAALRDRILATAPSARAKGVGGLFDWLRPGVGAMLAASCAAGVMAGFVLVSPPERADMGAADVVAALTGPSDAVLIDYDGEAG